MRFEHEDELLEKLEVKGNVLFSAYPDSEIRKNVSSASGLYFSPLVRFQLASYRGLVLWSIAFICFLFFIPYSLYLFFTKAMWYMHKKELGLPIFALDLETQQVEVLLFRPLPWIVAKYFLLLKSLTFFYYPPPEADDHGDDDGGDESTSSSEFGFDR